MHFSRFIGTRISPNQCFQVVYQLQKTIPSHYKTSRFRCLYSIMTTKSTGDESIPQSDTGETKVVSEISTNAVVVRSESGSTPSDSNNVVTASKPKLDGVNEDMSLSKRWRRQRRRGRLHKRQLEEADGTNGNEEGRGKKLRTDEDSAAELEAFNETDYYIENGLRKVYPYQYTYLCYCKERWQGKTILDMLNEEFLTESREYNKAHIERGCVKVNGKSVTTSHMLRGKNELISNLVHRHELPVTAQPIKIIEDNSDYLVIDKPSSIPVHPCGRYRHNSLTFILGKEYGYTHLRTVYRLDRLTSGLLIFGKNYEATNKIIKQIKDRQVSKQYLCRVEGDFPSGIIECKEPLDRVHHKLGTWRVKSGGKDSHTTFEKVSFDGTTSIVKCLPHTGRTHQIRVHLQYLGYPIANDPLYNDAAWGPEKGKGGCYHKSDEQLYKDLVAAHASKQYEHRVLSQSVDGLEQREESQLSNHELRLVPDPNCEWCNKTYMDPLPSQLTMYLHALSYKGLDWEYRTDEPLWAQSSCASSIP